MVSEAILCIKNARELFERTQAVNIIVWLLIQLIISVIFVYGCIMYHRYKQVIEPLSHLNIKPIQKQMIKVILRTISKTFCTMSSTFI